MSCFQTILKGEGSKEQNSVVIANAAMAIECGKGVSTDDALGMAEEALMSGKALKTFKTILEIS